MNPNLLKNLVLILLFPLIFTGDNVVSSSPSDPSALLAFKSKADLWNKLNGFSPNNSHTFCQWRGVQCSRTKVVRFVIEGIYLGGILAPNTLSRLDQLRVLSLQNTSLTGPVPDLSGLFNLKVLFLDHNFFSGSIPSSLTILHRLKTLDLSYNNLTGELSPDLNKLDRLYYLRVDSNRLIGSVPPLNQSTLETFNVSHNNLTGPIPVTPTLLRFKKSSFSWNPGLCGEIVHKECHEIRPFFGPAIPPPMALAQNAHQFQQGNHNMEFNQQGKEKHKIRALIIGLSISGFFLIGSIICLALATKKYKNSKNSSNSTEKIIIGESTATANVEAVMRIEEENHELEEKVKKVQEDMHIAGMGKSGSLLFCAGESQLYSLDQLMRASAELLGRGTMGTTYKAVLDNRLIVCVKRLDGSRLCGTSKDVFERHMESVGCLRHENLVPLRAYFQAKEERLLIYDYQPNGSLFSLIHGSKSARAKPLHWTSCLKIAEDLAQGLSYIHQAWRLVHGNLKSSNVLLGSDFEACLTDYCISALASPISSDDENNSNSDDVTAYWAPELRKSNQNQATSKSDVYSFGILLLELLSGKHPSQHPYLMPNEMLNWVRINRDDEDCENNKLEMILEVAIACSTTSQEQRPTMWQVLKMIQEIKQAVVMEENELNS
ncbi:hypothetical protein M9H77_32448 [Catharanthus roseus]|uniref:Uncharacterized protein n=1 Tax=Catharanthus roseus TaxID=4058 RepID=A0ACC0A6V1_CATRO|nr:hypothetical protein M9H77_32448 [Catharanthus roseus]